MICVLQHYQIVYLKGYYSVIDLADLADQVLAEYMKGVMDIRGKQLQAKNTHTCTCKPT